MMIKTKHKLEFYFQQWRDWLYKKYEKAGLKSKILPHPLVTTVLIICILPLLLNLMGFNFAMPDKIIDVATLSNLNSDELLEVLHHSLSGSFIHTILEWSAFSVAIFTAILALAHFLIKQDPVTPVIGMALLCAGCLDAFHILAANRLIDTVGDSQNLIPFTWFVCRFFNALLPLLVVSIFLGNQAFVRKTENLKIVFIIGFSLLISAITIIVLIATSAYLPNTVFPNFFSSRPWDILPLALFLGSGLFVYPAFYKSYPSLFSHALILSTLPNATTQIYMAFGSTELFDNGFNIAHFLKVIAYIVPLCGLVLDYVYTHQTLGSINEILNLEIEERNTTELALRQSQTQLEKQTQQLQKTLQELKQTQSQLIQSEKMSSLWQLVAGIAHEINNPVNFIYGNIVHLEEAMQDLIELIDLYEEALPNPSLAIQEQMNLIELPYLREDFPKMLNSMKRGSERIRQIVSSLRNFSRIDESELKAVDLHEGIDSTLVLLNSRITQQVSLIKNYGYLPNVECYPAQINQVWMHLLCNAIDAIEDKKEQYQAAVETPTILIETQQLDPQRVRIRIADNGVGIPDDVKAHIFDPFFTTKPIGSGTGLGLSICYSVIQQHQGEIIVNSKSGEGTEILIVLNQHFKQG